MSHGPHGSRTVIKHHSPGLSPKVHLLLTIVTGGAWIPFWIIMERRAHRTVVNRDSW